MAVAGCREILPCASAAFPASQVSACACSFPNTQSSQHCLPDSGSLVGDASPSLSWLLCMSRAALSILAPHNATLWDIAVYQQQDTQLDIFHQPGLSPGKAAPRHETTARYHHSPAMSKVLLWSRVSPNDHRRAAGGCLVPLAQPSLEVPCFCRGPCKICTC